MGLKELAEEVRTKIGECMSDVEQGKKKESEQLTTLFGKLEDTKKLLDEMKQMNPKTVELAKMKEVRSKLAEIIEEVKAFIASSETLQEILKTLDVFVQERAKIEQDREQFISFLKKQLQDWPEQEKTEILGPEPGLFTSGSVPPGTKASRQEPQQDGQHCLRKLTISFEKPLTDQKALPSRLSFSMGLSLRKSHYVSVAQDHEKIIIEIFIKGECQKLNQEQKGNIKF